ncbi:hypothetical protein Agub_g7202, partial [Astrephomene gubernaculifera]
DYIVALAARGQPGRGQGGLPQQQAGGELPAPDPCLPRGELDRAALRLLGDWRGGALGAFALERPADLGRRERREERLQQHQRQQEAALADPSSPAAAGAAGTGGTQAVVPGSWGGAAAAGAGGAAGGAAGDGG